MTKLELLSRAVVAAERSMVQPSGPLLRQAIRDLADFLEYLEADPPDPEQPPLNGRLVDSETSARIAVEVREAFQDALAQTKARLR